MVVKRKPMTPGTRWLVLDRNASTNAKDVKGNKYKVEKSLTIAKKRTGGRNNAGRITCRHRGGGHKKRIRQIDFSRDKMDIVGVVNSIQYDPNRSANIALIHYKDGEKRYIIAPNGLDLGSKVVSSENAECEPGNAMKMKNMPQGTMVHCIELVPGRGAVMARSAGTTAQIAGMKNKYCIIKLPSGERRMVHGDCMATVGVVSNAGHFLRSEGKAGRSRYQGIRPTVRGTAMNPIDHPRGGGNGRQNGYLAYSFSKVESKGTKTRRKKKGSSSFIVSRRKKR